MAGSVSFGVSDLFAQPEGVGVLSQIAECAIDDATNLSFQLVEGLLVFRQDHPAKVDALSDLLIYVARTHELSHLVTGLGII